MRLHQVLVVAHRIFGCGMWDLQLHEKVYGLKEDGVGIPESTKNLVPQDIIDYVNSMIEKVKSGEIKVPATEDEFNA